jgi:hypothetical protein
MSDEERRQYLAESLFLNFVSYENERLAAYLRKLRKKAEEHTSTPPAPISQEVSLPMDGPIENQTPWELWSWKLGVNPVTLCP